jgi:hypothetical protein
MKKIIKRYFIKHIIKGILELEIIWYLNVYLKEAKAIKRSLIGIEEATKLIIAALNSKLADFM